MTVGGFALLMIISLIVFGVAGGVIGYKIDYEPVLGVAGGLVAWILTFIIVRIIIDILPVWNHPL